MVHRMTILAQSITQFEIPLNGPSYVISQHSILTDICVIFLELHVDATTEVCAVYSLESEATSVWTVEPEAVNSE